MILKNYNKSNQYDPIEEEVKIGFAFLPTQDFITGDYFWLESYYYYQDLCFTYKSRKALYKSKGTFYTTLKT